MKQLQNEFKSGLRELDAVKAELAGSMMSSNRVIGGMSQGHNINNTNNLGALTSNVDRKKTSMVGEGSMKPSGGLQSSSGHIVGVGGGIIPQSSSSTTNNMGAEYLAAAQQAEESLQGNNNNSAPIATTATILAPRSQSVAAVAEEEWEKRGIGFKSIAERRGGIQQQHSGLDSTSSSSGGSIGVGGGSVILSNYIRQSLIYDQYERTVREQDEALRSRVDKVRNERMSNNIRNT